MPEMLNVENGSVRDCKSLIPGSNPGAASNKINYLRDQWLAESGSGQHGVSSEERFAIVARRLGRRSAGVALFPDRKSREAKPHERRRSRLGPDLVRNDRDALGETRDSRLRPGSSDHILVPVRGTTCGTLTGFKSSCDSKRLGAPGSASSATEPADAHLR